MPLTAPRMAMETKKTAKTNDRVEPDRSVSRVGPQKRCPRQQVGRIGSLNRGTLQLSGVLAGHE